MEKLSIIELLIYGGLAVKDICQGKLPRAVILANATESIVEWLNNQMIAGDDETGKKLSKPFEILGNFAAGIFGLKDSNGQAVRGNSALLANKGKVIGSLVTLFNGVGMLNSIYSFFTGFKQQNSAEREGPLAATLGILGPGLNGISMMVCSAIKELYGRAMSGMKVDKSESIKELIDGLITGQGEDLRCALKSFLAMGVDMLNATGFSGSKVVDGLGGILLNAFGLKNGIDGLSGREEEEGALVNLMDGSLARPLYSLGKWFLNLTGLKIPTLQEFRSYYKS